MFTDREERSADPQPGPILSIIMHAALLIALWLPFALGFLFLLPQFTPMYSILKEKGDLPTLTAWFLAVGKWSASWRGLPVVGLILMLVIVDTFATLIVRNRKWSRKLSWCSSIILGVSGLVAALLLVVALMRPIMVMPMAA